MVQSSTSSPRYDYPERRKTINKVDAREVLRDTELRPLSLFSEKGCFSGMDIPKKSIIARRGTVLEERMRSGETMLQD